MFTLTPIEGTLWHLGVAVQTEIALKVFGNVVFTGVVVFFLMKHVLQTLSSSAQGNDGHDIARQLLTYGFCVVMGLTLLRSVAATPFQPHDAGGRDWVSYRYVRSNADYQQLKNSTDGLWWYRLLHGATVSISKYMTSIASGIFGDDTFLRSPDLMFKLLTATAAVQLDDASITTELDDFLAQCSDTRKGRVANASSTMGDLLNMSNPACAQRYRELQDDLKAWVKGAMPALVHKAQRVSSDALPTRIVNFTRAETLENKVIGSALVNYGRQKVRGYTDAINTNVKELGIQDKSDHFWFNMQRIFSTGALPAMLSHVFTEGRDVEAGINRNEARIIYNNLVNLLPSFKGYVKLFIALAFIFAAAALCLGFTKPLLWWGSLLLMEMVYAPLATLNYEIHSMMLASSDIGQAFADLSRDPLALMGAALIDTKLVHYQTAYFISQFVIAALFVIGIVGSGFAINKMSFSQGAGFMGLAAVGNNRLLSAGARGVGKLAGRIRGRI